MGILTKHVRDELSEMAKKGFTDKEIALKLGIDPKTVSKYRKENDGGAQVISNTPSPPATGPDPESSMAERLNSDPDIFQMRKELELARMRKDKREYDDTIPQDRFYIADIFKIMAELCDFEIRLANYIKSTIEVYSQILMPSRVQNIRDGLNQKIAALEHYCDLAIEHYETITGTEYK